MGLRSRLRPKKFFVVKAKATIYETETRHVREQLVMYEHQDCYQLSFIISKHQYKTEMSIDGWIVCEY